MVADPEDIEEARARQALFLRRQTTINQIARICARYRTRVTHRGWLLRTSSRRAIAS
jgi:hypothetical protein